VIAQEPLTSVGLVFDRDRVQRVLEVIDGVEQPGVEAADVAPTYWQHVHNRLLCREQPRPYDPDQHHAWLLRRRMMAS
jgi:hypothetical protein